MDRPEAGGALQDPNDPMLLRCSKQIRLRLPLLLKQEVEMSVEPSHPRPRAGTELLLPRLAASKAVEIRSRHQDSARAIQTGEITAFLRQDLPKADISVSEEPFTMMAMFNTDRLQRDLGFTPRYTVEQGILEYLDDVRRREGMRQRA
jgi:hypothetical protein